MLTVKGEGITAGMISGESGLIYLIKEKYLKAINDAKRHYVTLKNIEDIRGVDLEIPELPRVDLGAGSD